MKPTFKGLADFIRRNWSLVPAVVVFPQAKLGTRWEFPAMEELVITELDRTIAEFHGESRHLYLTGSDRI